MVLPSTAVSILLQRDSGLLAVVCDDVVVRIIDIETRRIVRELTGFHGRILDIVGLLSLTLNLLTRTFQTFSPDSRWLVTTSLDSVIRTFDIPTGRLIDAFRTSSLATSLSLSPTNDFLATAHVDSVGVFLWYVPVCLKKVFSMVTTYRANRAQYTDVSFQGVDANDIFDAPLPSMQGIAEDEGQYIFLHHSCYFSSLMSCSPRSSNSP